MSPIARRSGGKDSLHGAEKKALLLGQLYVGPNSFVGTVCHRYSAIHVLFGVVLCSGFAGMYPKRKKVYFTPPRFPC